MTVRFDRFSPTLSNITKSLYCVQNWCRQPLSWMRTKKVCTTRRRGGGYRVCVFKCGGEAVYYTWRPWTDSLWVKIW